MRVGAVDMGSKNFKFVIGHMMQGTIATELTSKENLGLGREVTENDGVIGRKKLKQIEEVLIQFRQYCQGREAPDLLAIATSAIRNAKNHQQVADLTRSLGFSIEIADGVREGEVGYLAATGGMPNRLVSDSGSKSTQLAWESKGKILSRSIPVGYELAYESLVEHPASMQETRLQYSKFLSGNFKEVPENTDQFIALAANAITSFVTGGQRAEQHDNRLTRVAMNGKMAELDRLSPAEYANLKSSLPKVEKILPGMLFLDYLMERTGHTEIVISKTELPVGLIVEYFLKGYPVQ